MDKSFSKALRWAIAPVIILFYYIIFITVVIPLWKWGISEQQDAINMNVLSIAGVAVSFLSILLAVVFQILSSFSGRRLEGTVKEIESKLLKNNELTEHIIHNQDAITKGLVDTLGKLAQRPNAGETAIQQPGNWSPDFSN